MLKDCVAILTIGSSNINIIVGKKGVNNTFSFHANITRDYYAFLNGEFTDIKELESVISEMFTTITKSTEISEINKIYVGIPGEFHKTLTKNYKITFNKLKTIGLNELITLYDLAYEATDVEYSLAHRSAVYFAVDNVKVDNPLGKKCTSLGGRLSYSLVTNNFKEVITSILRKCKVKDVYFISEDYAESQYLFTKSEKNVCKILIDIGSVTTSFSVSVGNGLLFSGSVPVGGGIISAYLYDKFNCEYYIAELLKQKINLGLRENAQANYYIVDNDGEDFRFSRNITNDIAKSVLDEIAEKFERVFATCPLKIPSDTDTYFTGGGRQRRGYPS